MASWTPDEAVLAKMDEHFGTRSKRLLRLKAAKEFSCAKCGAQPGQPCINPVGWWHTVRITEVHDERLVVAIMVYGPPQPSGMGDD
jgi:hypothetical protein